MNRSNYVDLLVCPETKQPVRACSIEEAEAAISRGTPLAPRQTGARKAVGRTPTVMLRADLGGAYPVVDGVPVLLAPELLVPAECRSAEGTIDSRYADAYAEMEHYNSMAAAELRSAARSTADLVLAAPRRATIAQQRSFPTPRTVWLDSVYDLAAQWEAYRHISPVARKRILQVGGTGLHAIKLLLAGADQGWLVTPMLGEAILAQTLAREYAVAERFRCVAGIAEALPLVDEQFDAVYAGSCMHHTRTDASFPECARVLRPGGRFAAMEPWRAPLYRLGIRLFGKREAGTVCRPMDRARVKPLFTAFGKAEVIQHGALTRYPLLALQKLGISAGPRVVWTLTAWDDALTARSGLRRMGSSAALLGTRMPDEVAAG